MEKDVDKIIEGYREVVDKGRQIESLLKSGGWKCYLEIKEKRKQEMMDKMFKSEMTVKKHEYNRGAINFTEDIENELRGYVDEARAASKSIEELEY
ncbi:MAG: hypothetical protein ACTSSH_00045 [Candidatus Heimdallarchaeota archaeon]